MAGHSKWHNIRHRKAAVDKKRSKVWSKCARAIMAAARQGGSDPSINLSLRYAIDEARYANMPRDTIERAVKKGAGELKGQDFESIRYEGYGPAGVAIVIDALTDNRNRTATEVRHAFSKFGGNLGQTNSVAFQFETKGQIIVKPDGVDADALMETAIEAGAEDIEAPETDGDPWLVTTDPTEFQGVKDALEGAGYELTDASIELIAGTTVEVSADSAETVMKLIDALEDDDDVQKVFHNAELPEDAAL